MLSVADEQFLRSINCAWLSIKASSLSKQSLLKAYAHVFPNSLSVLKKAVWRAGKPQIWMNFSKAKLRTKCRYVEFSLRNSAVSNAKLSAEMITVGSLLAYAGPLRNFSNTVQNKVTFVSWSTASTIDLAAKNRVSRDCSDSSTGPPYTASTSFDTT